MLADFLQPDRTEAGCDEAGRGCLAGPVFAAAVIIPKGVKIDGLNDSKQLTEVERNLLRPQIESQCIWAVASLSPKIIDKINILNASIKAMQMALEQLTEEFHHIVVDGNRFKPFKKIPYTTVIKGDGKLKSIAAASILAKTHRDEYMQVCLIKNMQRGRNSFETSFSRSVNSNESRSKNLGSPAESRRRVPGHLQIHLHGNLHLIHDA